MIVATVVAAGASPALAGSKSRKIGAGVTLTQITKKRPNLRIKVVRVSRKKVRSIRAVLGSGKLPGYERTTSIARRHRAVVAINGDYARRSGRPVMAFVNRWQVRQTPLTWGRNFALSHGSRTFIGHPKLSSWMTVDGIKYDISRINNDGPFGNKFAMFDKMGGYIERPPKRTCSVRVKSAGMPRSDRAQGNVFARFKVDRVSCSKDRLFPLGGRVISARWQTSKAAVIRSLSPGENVWLGWTMGWDSIRESVGGNPTLIENGNIVVEKSRHPFFARNPRTAVGVTASGAVLFVTVDGRQRRSIGMTLRGLARFMRKQGARHALNLDGGGSTTMVVRGKVLNRPSDGRERPVSSALVVLSSKSKRKRNLIKTVPAAKVWKAASSDAASTGGLAGALQQKGADLPSDLARAAATISKRS